MENFLLAACQLDCGPDSRPKENFEKILAHTKEAAAKGARLVLFPELSLSGYSVDPSDIAERMRETEPSFIEQLHATAREHALALAVGVYEPSRSSGKVHNVTVAIAPDGREFRYHKMHIPPNEAAFAPSETGARVADLGFVKLGICTCFDAWFPEATRMAFMAGAEMLFMPFAWPAEWEVCDDLPRKRTSPDRDAVLRARRERMMKVFPARALDNALFIVMLDHAHDGPATDDPKALGKQMPGKSMVFDPYGDLLAEAEGWREETLTVEIDAERLTEWRDSAFFPGRRLRPDIYIEAYKRFQAESDT